MSKFYRLVILVLWNCLCLTFVHGQATIPSTGGNSNGSGGSVSYSVGQVLCSTISGANGTIIQGVQQPYEISIVTVVENLEGINLKCSVYPNPTAGAIKMVLESNDNEGSSFRLYDMNGTHLLTKIIENFETDISLENLPPGVYFLHVIRNNMDIKVFKIIKK